MSSIAAVRRSRSRFFSLSKVEPYLFLTPFFALLLIFNLYTIIVGLRLGCTDAFGIEPGQWVGLRNYIDLVSFDYIGEFSLKQIFDSGNYILSNMDFWPSIWRSFKYMFGSLFTQIPSAFILACILNATVFGRIRGILRGAFFVPVLINTVVAALLFRLLFNKDTGLINWLLAHAGFAKIDWLFTPELCLPLMIIVSFWQWTGYHMVYLLASMQAIDPTIYEVAKLDGASSFRTMFQITLPLIKPAVIFCTIMSAIGGMRQFEYSFMLFPNAGFGPDRQAMTGVPFIYDLAFSTQSELGMATAACWLLFLIILVIVLIQIFTVGLGQAEDY